ncbi:MAG: proline dehydrogenase family protein [Candidatus Limnocylindria bacterium]
MLSSALRAFLLWLSNRRWIAHLALGIPFLRRMPLRFVAGTTLDEAVAAVRTLNAGGASATLDVLGESVHDRASADLGAAAYVQAIERIAAAGLDANVSLKLTQMGLDLGVDECLAVLAPVVAAGGRHGVFVRVDMESSDYTDRTLEIVRQLRAAGHDAGPVVQSYLRRSPADVDALAAERVRTRVCKGAYLESPEVAHQDREAIGDAYVALCTRLLEADAYPGVATHDPDIIERVAAAAKRLRVPSDRFEFQMLYGIRRDLQRQLVRRGYRLRVYVPYGSEWYPYFMRRLAERPANLLFVVRSVFGERP